MAASVEVPQLGPGSSEAVLFFTLLQLTVVLIAARAAGHFAPKLGQPSVVGEIVVGILLGPSFLGALAPETFALVFQSPGSEPLRILGQIGLMLLMFQIGLEFDFSHLRAFHNRKVVVLVASSGMLLPFGAGLLLGYLSAPYLASDISPSAYSLFMATAFSVTAVPVLGRIMMEFDITGMRIGVITLTAAALNDVVGWLLLAVVTGLALSQFSRWDLPMHLGYFALYAAVCWWLIRPMLRGLITRFSRGRPPFPKEFLGILLCLLLISSMVTYQIGISTIFGGFMMGVLLFDQRELAAAWKGQIGDFVTVFFLPIFFTYTGLRTDINGLDSGLLWGWCGIIMAVAMLAKVFGCYWAARIAGLARIESKIIGVMMNTRGLMELIVLNIGYELKVLPANVFTMLVLMAILSTVITAPALRIWLPALGRAPLVEPPRGSIDAKKWIG